MPVLTAGRAGVEEEASAVLLTVVGEAYKVGAALMVGPGANAGAKADKDAPGREGAAMAVTGVSVVGAGELVAAKAGRKAEGVAVGFLRMTGAKRSAALQVAVEQRRIGCQFYTCDRVA